MSKLNNLIEAEDVELLELAAKAAGIELYCCNTEGVYAVVPGSSVPAGWNPLVYDSDALQLAVKLKIDLEFGSRLISASMHTKCAKYLGVVLQQYRNDPYAATRRAIARAAAEIGK